MNPEYPEQLQQQQQQLYAGNEEDTLPLYPQQPCLGPPPSYLEAMQSLARYSWATSEHDFILPMDEVDGQLQYTSLSTLMAPSSSQTDPQHELHPSLHPETTPFPGLGGPVHSPPGSYPRWSSSTLPYPSRPPSNPGEVPGSSLAQAEHGEYSLYNLDTANSSVLDGPGWSTTPSTPPTPRPRSTVSVLSDMEQGNIGAAGGWFGSLSKAAEEEDDDVTEDFVDVMEEGAEGGGEDLGDLDLGRRRNEVLENKRKLLQDVEDEELLDCARKAMETDDNSLLTKMMLKTKLQLLYVSKGQAVPDVTAFPAKEETRQLRPEEEEKVDRRKRNGRVSAKTYRNKQKQMKQEKETLLKELQQKNSDLKVQVRTLEEAIQEMRRRAVEKNLLIPTTTTSAPTTTAASSSRISNVMDRTQPPGDAIPSLMALPPPTPSSSSPCSGGGGHVAIVMFPQTPPPR